MVFAVRAAWSRSCTILVFGVTADGVAAGVFDWLAPPAGEPWLVRSWHRSPKRSRKDFTPVGNKEKDYILCIHTYHQNNIFKHRLLVHISQIQNRVPQSETCLNCYILYIYITWPIRKYSNRHQEGQNALETFVITFSSKTVTWTKHILLLLLHLHEIIVFFLPESQL